MPLRRRVLALAACVLVLAGCRLDVSVGVTVGADGSGEVTVVAAVDKDVVDRVSGLAGSLSLEDAAAAGWEVEGPATTEDGGLTLALRRPFVTVQEAASLLNSLGPPFSDVAFERTATEEEVTVTMSGALILAGGSWDAFGDPNLLQVAGGTPFGAQLAESGASPPESMTVDLTVQFPGEVEETTGERGGDGVTWSAPLDGSSQDLATRAVLRAESASGWAGPVATVALVALVLWLAGGITLAAMVIRARARRRNRPVRRLY
jgi:hypothetical protein